MSHSKPTHQSTPLQKHGVDNKEIVKKGFSVAASPLNGVKLELALIMVMAGVFMLMVDKISSSAGTQLLLLLGFGLLATGWLVIRTRMIMKQQLQQSGTISENNELPDKPAANNREPA